MGYGYRYLPNEIDYLANIIDPVSREVLVCCFACWMPPVYRSSFGTKDGSDGFFGIEIWKLGLQFFNC